MRMNGIKGYKNGNEQVRFLMNEWEIMVSNENE